MASRIDAASYPVWPAARHRLPPAALAIGLLLGTVGCGEPIDQLIAQAAAMRDAGNYRAAADKLNAALTRQPKNTPARLLAAQIYLGRGDAALGLLMRARQDGVDQRQF